MTDTVNPPAFPFPSDCDAGEPGDTGMTLLDYMAAKAMQGIVSQGSTIPKEIAEASYFVADAMLKARQKWIK